jgi:DNA-binding NarL/FixJ family response regulator
MSPHQVSEQPLAPELEAIAIAAADRLRAPANGNTDDDELRRRVADAASAAIAAGVPLGAIAAVEQVGQARARHELGSDVLRQVERAARRKREADSEYEQAVVRAARLGLAHREIATAGGVAHGTVRAIIARTDTPAAELTPSAGTVSRNGSTPEQA